MGELKAAGAKDNNRCEYRLYYGQPDLPTDLVVGLNLNEKVIHAARGATTTGQDADIGKAANAFRAWLKQQQKEQDEAAKQRLRDSES